MLRWLFDRLKGGQAEPAEEESSRDWPEPQTPLTSMSYRLVVGLGNPGPTYADTRHNIGFEVLDCLAERCGAAFREEKRGPAEVTRVGEGLLLKPWTYMNRSGEAVRAWLDWKKWQADDVLIVTDDVALPLGAIRLRKGGSDGGHNGLASIEKHLGTRRYARLRCGVGPMPPMWRLEKFVLAKYGEGEVEARADLLKTAVEALTVCLEKGMDVAMNRFNARVSKAGAGEAESTEEKPPSKNQENERGG